jgi:hypothetical protein
MCEIMKISRHVFVLQKVGHTQMQGMEQGLVFLNVGDSFCMITIPPNHGHCLFKRRFENRNVLGGWVKKGCHPNRRAFEEYHRQNSKDCADSENGIIPSLLNQILHVILTAEELLTDVNSARRVKAVSLLSVGFFFGGAASMYSQDEEKTIKPPGITRGLTSVPKRIGERKRRIPVATAEARHFITASASEKVSNILLSWKDLTFIHGSDSKTNHRIAHYDQDCSQRIVARPEVGLICFYQFEGDVQQDIDTYTGCIEKHILGVQRLIMALQKSLVVNTGH